MAKTLFQYVINERIILSWMRFPPAREFGGEYRSRTDDLPEASSGRPGPYTAKTLLQYVMNLLFPKK